MAINKKTRRSENAKNPAGEPASIVVQNIDVRPIHRKKQNIPDWRAAIQSAEAQNPRLWQLYSLYHDVALDAKVIAVTGKRFDAVTTANWQFVNKEGEAVEIINDIIDSIGFETIVKEILNAKFWGYSIFEPKFYKAHENNWEVVANLLPRLHYRPQKGIISQDGISDDGINIREGIYAKTVMEVGDPKDLGLFASAAQYQVLKRGGIGDYAMFVQVFGRPIIDATYDGIDDTQRQRLKQDLDIGAGGVIVRPDGTTIQVIESKGNQSTIHQDFKKDMNDEIALALLGTTETTESSDSSGYAQAEMHGDADNKKSSGDINYVRRYLNSRFVKVLEAHGIETEGGKFIVDDAKSSSKKESFELLAGAKYKFGLPIDDDHIYETLGIPKPDDYDAQKKQQEEAVKPEAEMPGQTDQKKADKKGKKPPKNTDEKEDETEVKLFAKFGKALKDFFLKAPAQVGAINGKHHTINLTFKNTFKSDAFIQRVYDNNGTLTFDADLFSFTLKTLLKGFKSGWDKELVKLNSGLGFTYNYDDPAMLTAFELNLFRFAGAKDLALVQKLNEIFRSTKSFQEFYEEASKHTQIFNANYLDTEYNTAVLTGESAATYNRLKGITDVYPYWRYKTASDEHVRHSHKPLHDIILRHDDPRWDKLFPPNGWNCRCWIEPVLEYEVDKSKLAGYQAKADAYLKSPAFAKESAQGWGVNRGKTGEIFTANQQYINTFQNNSSAVLSDLKASDWGLQQYSNSQKIANANAPVYDGDIDAFFTELEGTANKVINDYNKRILKVDKNIFVENNKMVLNAFKETLAVPDEVWVQPNQNNQLIYIKYYKNKTIAVRAVLDQLELSVKDFTDLENNKELIKTFRKGLLVKSN